MGNQLEIMPEGYHLHAYDECGTLERQPHVKQKRAGVIAPDEAEADAADRLYVWDRKQIDIEYPGVDRRWGYVVVLTFVGEKHRERVQSVWAGKHQILTPHLLHAGWTERLILSIPKQAVDSGKLRVTVRNEGGHSAMLSAVELWSEAEPPKILRFTELLALYGDLRGVVSDMRFHPAGGATVSLSAEVQDEAFPSEALSAVISDPDGGFRFDRKAVEQAMERSREACGEQSIVLSAERGADGCRLKLGGEQLVFEPVRYRPLPAQVTDLSCLEIMLDGRWFINPSPHADFRKPDEDFRKDTLDTKAWKEFAVPGQWVQQGFDIPQDQAIALFREFTLPEEWKGCRVFLRFDSIHGGTDYWVNGTHLGYSENLYTPVEWDITDAAKPGAVNRLHLRMTVDTVSERLSYSSGYAFHSLGGIDRSVRVYALPPSHISALRLCAELDDRYVEGRITARWCIHRVSRSAGKALAVRLALYSHENRLVAQGEMEIDKSDPPAQGMNISEDGMTLEVEKPEHWTAETPVLYQCVIELREGERVLESIRRFVGFRRIEIKGSRFCINGQAVMLPGACHHEIDPLSGRAGTVKHAEKDIELMKGANLNYLRTSHYPPPIELLEAADRLGMYVEVEAPFCWVRENERGAPLKEILGPTSAMIDYCHTHPSVILWSLANESHFHDFFEVSNELCKDLDPSRPTTFNDPDPKRICDVANLHYAPMPYDERLPGDPRPIFLGEYFFPICHEQTDVRINPGLRELWGHGHADPKSDWAKACAESFDGSFMHPCALPGTWDHIIRSERVMGGAIWALIDEPFFLPSHRKVGYAWVHGYWGIVDAWRRPKPEWWLAKQIFSPVWFPGTEAAVKGDQIRLAVENRFSFTHLRDHRFQWKMGEESGETGIDLAPGETGVIAIPLGKASGSAGFVEVSVYSPDRQMITARRFTVAHKPQRPADSPAKKSAETPADEPAAASGHGKPSMRDEPAVYVVEGRRFRLELGKAGGVCVVRISRGELTVKGFPAFHLTRIDLADLVHPRAAPYAVFPETGTRAIRSVNVRERTGGIEIAVEDSYRFFEGEVRWLLDAEGRGEIRYDYAYSGPSLKVREIGIRVPIHRSFDTLRWRRWSEWGVFPPDHISRTCGTANARRDIRLGAGGEEQPPSWAWALDQTALGTNDFRSVKFNIYEACLESEEGNPALTVAGDADVHVRACLDAKTNDVLFHLLDRCRLGPRVLDRGDRISGGFDVRL